MILISAGHHPGAQGATAHGRTEWPTAMLWRDEIVRNLAHRGTAVPYGLLRDKVTFINLAKPALVLEIHFNSAIVHGKHVGKGCETLYKPDDPRSERAAEVVQAALASIYPPNRGIHEGWLKRDRPGVVDYDGDVEGDERISYLLDRSKCPALIIEPEFIHRYKRIDKHMGRACLAISNALIELMQEWDI